MSRGGSGIPLCRDTVVLLSRSWAGRIGPDDGVEPSVALGKAKQGGRLQKKLVCAFQQFLNKWHSSMARAFASQPEDPSRRRKLVVL